MADKCSIKRSVLGAMCKLGSNVKIINCVLMDGVEVQDGCHLQNSIICPNAHLQVSPPCPLHMLSCPLHTLSLGRVCFAPSHGTVL